MFLHLKEEYNFDSILSSKVGWFINSHLFNGSHHLSFSFSRTRSRTSSRSWGPWEEPATTRTSASWQTGSGSSVLPGPSLLLFIMTFTTFWEKLHNQIILASRCDNIASLLSDSTKYAFAATQNDQTELETEFDLDTVLNLPVSAFDEGIDLEATTYVAGYITHKVRVWYWYLSSFLFHISH